MISVYFAYLANCLRVLLQALAVHHQDFLEVSLELQALVEEQRLLDLVGSLPDSQQVAHLHQASLLREDRAWSSMGRKRSHDGLRKGGENSSTVSALRGVGFYIPPKIVTL
jgi:hypothetical protein